MVKLGFVKYESSDSGIVSSVKTLEPKPIKTKSLFPFINSGVSIRDYVKKKIFKATAEEVSTLLKSTSNLNLAGKFSSKSTSDKKSKEQKKKKEKKDKSYHHETPKELISYENPIEIMETELSEINESPAIIKIDSSTEVEEPVVVIKSKSFSRFSIRLSKRKKKTRFAEDLTQSLPAPSCSSSSPQYSKLSSDTRENEKIAKWKKMNSKVVKPYDLMKKKNTNKSTGKSGDEKKENLEPVKWSKKVRKFAARTCRYLGYGAQMVSPLTPYTDVPMPMTYNGVYNVYPPYTYASEPYYSYSDSGNTYGYRMSHYGLTY